MARKFGKFRSYGAPRVSNVAPAVSVLAGLALIVISVDLAYDRNAVAAAFLVCGSGLFFLGGFAHRIHGETTLGKDGIQTQILEAVTARAEDEAESRNVPADALPEMKAAAARNAELFANATTMEHSATGIFEPIVTRYRQDDRSLAMPTAGTVDFLARDAVDRVLIPNAASPSPSTVATPFTVRLNPEYRDERENPRGE